LAIFEFPEKKIFGTAGSAPIQSMLNYLRELEPARFQISFDARSFFGAN
jgi:hypothetical protein